MKKLTLILMTLCIAVAANAQLLWRVSGNGAKGDTYILGTHHIAPVSMLDSLPDFGKVLEGADVVIGEIDMAIMADQAALQQQMLPMVMAPADSTLSKVLSPAQIDSLDKVVRDLTGGMANAAAFEAMKPALVSQQLTMVLNMKENPQFNGAEQLDATVQQRAHAAGKPVEGLETFGMQVETLFGEPIAAQAEELMELVREPEKAARQTRELAEAYRSADLKRIERLFDEDSDMTPAQRARLIDDRNDAWIKEIQRRLPQQQMLIAVGAGHLVGPKGLISQLRSLGYTVTPAK